MSASDHHDEAPVGGWLSPGAPGYAGYEYQIKASVWVALALIFEHEQTRRVEVEPASLEDLELDLNANADAASPTLLMQERLIVQVKHRSNPWSIATFKKALTPKDHSERRRESALERLIRQPEARYLLITDAQLPATLGSLRAKGLLEGPTAPSLPPGLVPDGVDEDELAKRISVLDQLHPDMVTNRIRALLAEELSVVSSKQAHCEAALIEEVRKRLLGQPGEWTREQILGAVEPFGGNARRAGLKGFVRPRNYSELQARLTQEHAVLLYGPPGAGKTQTAEALKLEHKQMPAPFETVQPQSPAEMRQRMREPGRVLFELEDPWGRDARTALAELWRDELDRLMAQATDDKRVLVTSRVALLHELGIDVDRKFKRYAIELSYDDYPPEARLQILLNALGESPSGRQFVRVHQERILEVLKAPVSLYRFAQLLNNPSQREPGDIEALLRASDVDELAPYLAGELEPLDWAFAPAVVLWAALSTSMTFRREELLHWRAAMRIESETAVELDRLLDWMIAGRRLKPEGESYRAHPTTVAGIEKFLRREKDRAATLLDQLISGLVAEGRIDDAYSAASEAMPQRGLIAQLAGSASEGLVTGQSWVRLRETLRAQLPRANEEQFPKLFRFAVRLLVKENDPVSVAVWGLATYRGWSDAEQAQVRVDQDAVAVVEHYVRWVLPRSGETSQGRFATQLRNLGFDLDAAFRDALKPALASLSYGMVEVVHGVLGSQKTDVRALLAELLRREDELNRSIQDKTGDLQKKQSQKMTDAWENAWLHDFEMDEQFALQSALTAVVRELRQRNGYRWLLRHERRNDLLFHWAELLKIPPLRRPLPRRKRLLGSFARWWASQRQKHFDRIRRRELRTLYRYAIVAQPSIAFHLLLSAPGAETLVPDVLATLRDGDETLVGDALAVLRAKLPPEELEALVRSGFSRASSRRRAVVRMHSLLPPVQDSPGHQRAVAAALAVSAATAVEACVRAEEEPLDLAWFRALSVSDRAALREWGEGAQNRLGRNALVALAAAGEPVLLLARSCLSSTDNDTRTAAVRALSLSQVPDARASLFDALRDGHYACRLLALQALVPRANEQERKVIIALARDPSVPVRRASVAAIRAGRWQEGSEVLCQLLTDDWTPTLDHTEANHPIAVEAAEALDQLPDLPAVVVEKLAQFLLDGLESNRDIRVHQSVASTLDRVAPEALFAVLVRMLPALARAAKADSNASMLRNVLAASLAVSLGHHPRLRERVDLTLLRELAMEPMEDVAFAGWLALATMGAPAWRMIHDLLSDQTDAQARIVLLTLTAAKFGHELENAPFARVNPSLDEPVSRVGQWLREPPADPQGWRARWQEHPRSLEWLLSLASGSREQRQIHEWLSWLWGSPFQDSLPLEGRESTSPSISKG